MLKISNVETFYGKIQALRGVDLDVNDGDIVSLIGSNGAGKSTLLMTISGVNKAKYWLDIIGLTHRADDNAGDLPYGDQRKLEIVRAMCIEPRLLCLDEPAAGLNPKESAELNKLLKFIKTEKQTGILLIEHDMSVVMGISDHVVVLNYGKKIFEGTADQTKNSNEVIEAYLGVDE